MIQRSQASARYVQVRSASQHGAVTKSTLSCSLSSVCTLVCTLLGSPRTLTWASRRAASAPGCRRGCRPLPLSQSVRGPDATLHGCTLLVPRGQGAATGDTDQAVQAYHMSIVGPAPSRLGTVYRRRLQARPTNFNLDIIKCTCQGHTVT